jgi:xylan 1,4-beta-xylosidase
VLHHVHEQVDSFAFWTISDIFNEFPYPRATFVGGFGLMTIDGVPKPGYHAYGLLHRLGDTELPVQRLDAGEADLQHGGIDLWATREGSDYQLLLSNYLPPRLDGTVHTARPFTLSCEGLLPGTILRATEHRVDSEHANGLSAWEKLGRPDTPTRQQLTELRAAAALEPLEPSILRADHAGRLTLSGTMQPGSVTLFELSASAG